MRFTEENSYISGETGSSVGGIVAKFLDIEHLIPFRKVIYYDEGKCQIDFEFDYYGIRYHLLLKRNELLEHCEENARLNDLAENLEDPKNTDTADVKCLDLFWPYVAEDSIQQEVKTTTKPTLENRFQEKNTVKIKLVTDRDGKLSRVHHNEPSLYPFSDPIKNPCPSNIPVFQMEDIEFLDEISFNVFKARLGGVMVCVKGASRDRMLPEIEILVKAPNHPSISSPLLGLVDARQGCIDKFIVPFIVGRQISRIQKASLEQKAAWKRQISEAIALLHKTGIAWGDGSIWNVMIDDESSRAILIDFGEGTSEGCKGFEATKFEAAKSYDLEALTNIHEYIDGLQATPTEKD